MPLAITQAAAYIRRRGCRSSVRQYLEEFQNSDQSQMSLLDVDKGAMNPLMNDMYRYLLHKSPVGFPEHTLKATPGSCRGLRHQVLRPVIALPVKTRRHKRAVRPVRRGVTRTVASRTHSGHRDHSISSFVLSSSIMDLLLGIVRCPITLGMMLCWHIVHGFSN